MSWREICKLSIPALCLGPSLFRWHIADASERTLWQQTDFSTDDRHISMRYFWHCATVLVIYRRDCAMRRLEGFASCTHWHNSELYYNTTTLIPPDVKHTEPINPGCKLLRNRASIFIENQSRSNDSSKTPCRTMLSNYPAQDADDRSYKLSDARMQVTQTDWLNSRHISRLLAGLKADMLSCKPKNS